jgi:hypothetical protein
MSAHVVGEVGGMTKLTGTPGGPTRVLGPPATRLVVPVDFAVTTLREAHDLVSRLRPGSDAPAGEWLAFRGRAVQIYRAVADIDRYHHHEAMYWVEHEQQAATDLVTHIHTQRHDTTISK